MVVEEIIVKTEKVRVMSELWRLFLGNQGRVVHKWHHYFPIYERHFSPYVDRQITFLEIGCGEGGSLPMWKKYFGPMATIVGIDCNPACKNYEETYINVRIGDQGDKEFLKSVIEEFGPFDIVLDDGSHIMDDVKTSFLELYPHVTRNGVYMIEDMHTAYFEACGGGFRKEGSFIEFSKDLIDHLNVIYTAGQLPVSDFARTTLSMHFYDSIVAFEKGKYGNRIATMIGGMPV